MPFLNSYLPGRGHGNFSQVERRGNCRGHLVSLPFLRDYSLCVAHYLIPVNDCLMHFVCFMVAHGENASLTSVTPSCLLGKAVLTIVEAFTSCSLSSVCTCLFSLPQTW